MSEITNEAYGARRSNDHDDDCGSNPSELYGRATWKIEKFSQINTREIRSDVFEVGDYKWYLLMYPQGCDVCYHLSVFLCVANHDKLLPGWSHLAQFTVTMVNKDPKKLKASDAIHQFWKKEHDWGWKKFIELPRLRDGFIDDSDSLIIKAQVQVIRESVDRPFRCLDGWYRKEVLRMYSTRVEQIFLSFAEEKRSKLVKLIDDKKRWKSLCAFWLRMEQKSKLEMSREKMDVILKLVVKQFFVKNEVTSTLVMDCLFYGLKSLEEKKRLIHKLSELVAEQLLLNKDSLHDRSKTLEEESKKKITNDAKRSSSPIVRVEEDMFVLVHDIMLHLERFVLEPLPEKGLLNLVSVGNVCEKYNMELDEKRLTKFGIWTLEVFFLDHIFCNKIEVAYKEAIALKRQEELIHEEEEEKKKKKNKVNSRLY